MRKVSYDYDEFEEGDKVRLITNWYEENGFPFKKGDIFTVRFQEDEENVWTDKGIFSAYELELVEED